MNRTWTWTAALAATLMTAGTQAWALDVAPDTGVGAPAQFQLKNYSGPRLGLMFPAGGAEMRKAFRDHGYGDMVSLFGWHFERTIVPIEGGPQLVTEAIPMLGGVEYGKILPSLTLTAGLRLSSGLEFGMGPSFTPLNSRGGATTGLVLAIGKSIEYAGLNLPVNLATSINPKGTMVSLTLGYAMQKN